MSTWFLIALCAALAGCGRHQLRPATYRFTNHILIPPGVKDANLSERTVTLPLAATCTASESGVRFVRRGRSIRLTVNRPVISALPPGWLAAWGTSLEKQGCLANGDGIALANRIVESVPLNPILAYDLLHASITRAGYVDLGPEHHLRVTSPILLSEAGTSSAAIGTPVVSEQGGKLTVTMQASQDFLGYEIAWYAVEPHANRPGMRIVPLSVEDRIDGNVSRPNKPRSNYFRFTPDAAYYRLFYLTRLSQADHDIDLLAASSRVDLEDETKRLESDPGLCEMDLSQVCTVLRHDVAVNPYLVLTANGADVTIPIGGTVRAAVRAAGIGRPESILSTLIVKRRYGGRLAPVTFNRNQTEILDLPLIGREDIRW